MDLDDAYPCACPAKPQRFEDLLDPADYIRAGGMGVDLDRADDRTPETGE